MKKLNCSRIQSLKESYFYFNFSPLGIGSGIGGTLKEKDLIQTVLYSGDPLDFYQAAASIPVTKTELIRIPNEFRIGRTEEPWQKTIMS